MIEVKALLQQKISSSLRSQLRPNNQLTDSASKRYVLRIGINLRTLSREAFSESFCREIFFLAIIIPAREPVSGLIRTGGLDDIQLRLLEERLRYLRELEDRRAAIIASITEQNNMTPELLDAVTHAEDKTRLEELYLPYKQKRRTKTQIAIEAGLAPLDEERTDLQKIQSQWHKLSGLHTREEWSAAIVRAATAAELVANFAIRTEFIARSEFDAAFVSSLLRWANGLAGKLDKLLVPLSENEKQKLKATKAFCVQPLRRSIANETQLRIKVSSAMWRRRLRSLQDKGLHYNLGASI